GGGGDQDLSAGMGGWGQGIVEPLLAAGSHRDLGWAVVEAVLPLELADDGGLELRDTINVGVLGLALAQRLDRSLFDVFRGVEVGLTGGQRNDVAALGL